MRDFILRWLNIPPSPAPTPSLNADVLALLTKPYEAHIASLKAQIVDQQKLIQVLSDEKFFKPEIIPAPEPVLETSQVFDTKDYDFTTHSDGPPSEDTTTESELAGELDALSEEYAKLKTKG